MARKSPKTVIQPAWHANFRNVDALPDIKVIRTDFLLNFVAGIVALACLGFVLYNELSIRSLSGQASELREEVNSLNAANQRSLRANSQFVAKSSRVNQIVSFRDIAISPSLLLQRITLPQDEGGLVPTDMTLNSVSLSTRFTGAGRNITTNRSVIVNGVIYGDEELTTSDLLRSYVSQIPQDEIIGEFIADVEQDSPDYDAEFGTLTFRFIIILNDD